MKEIEVTIIEAIHDIGDIFTETASKVGQELATALSPITALLDAVSEAVLQIRMRQVATPREWHLYKHSKKKRIREKYRKRLQRRLLGQFR